MCVRMCDWCATVCWFVECTFCLFVCVSLSSVFTLLFCAHYCDVRVFVCAQRALIRSSGHYVGAAEAVSQ